MGKYGRILGGLLLTCFFLWLALRNVDIAAVRDALRHASYGYLLPAALCCVCGYLLRTWRWQRILAPTKVVPFLRLFPVLMAGFAANNLLPARVGEFVRAYLLSREEGQPRDSGPGDDRRRARLPDRAGTTGTANLEFRGVRDRDADTVLVTDPFGNRIRLAAIALNVVSSF